MKLAELLQGVCADPGDRAQRAVLADALLEAGSPRGGLMATQLAGQPVSAQLLERCVARVREAVPGLSFVRFVGGLVSELEVELEQLPHADTEWLQGEPLVRVHCSSAYEPEPLERELDAAHEQLAACRGFGLASRVGEDCWPVLRDRIGQLAPRALSLDLIPDQLEGGAPLWPTIEHATLAGSHAVIAQLLAGMPELRQLELRSGPLAPCLEHPVLRHLDLRTLELDAEQLEALARWLAQDEQRSVRHPHFGLGPPDLDDAFGCSGSSWSPEEPLRCRVAAIPAAKRPSFIMARGRQLQLYRNDNPSWERTLAAPATAVAARTKTLLVGREDGVVEALGLRRDSKGATIVTLPGPVLGIDATEEDLAVRGRGGWWARVGQDVMRGEETLSGLVLTPSGLAHSQGSELRVGSERYELGETIHALAADGQMLLVIAGRHVWQWRAGALRCLGLRRGHGRPAVAGRGALRIWTNWRSGATLLRGAKSVAVSYPTSYSAPSSLELAVADVCVLDERIAVTALEQGGANLLLRGSAMKADEFPGEPHRSWIFVYEGKILTAG